MHGSACKVHLQELNLSKAIFQFSPDIIWSLDQGEACDKHNSLKVSITILISNFKGNAHDKTCKAKETMDYAYMQRGNHMKSENFKITCFCSAIEHISSNAWNESCRRTSSFSM